MYKKVSKEITLILVMAVFLTLPLSVVPLSHAQSNKAMQDVLKIHNDERKAVGNQPLTWSDSLAAEAQAYADHLATLGIVCGPPHHPESYANLLLPTVLRTKTWLLAPLYRRNLETIHRPNGLRSGPTKRWHITPGNVPG